MIEVLLVFSVNGAPEEISQTVFVSYEQCENFVNTLVGDDVVNSDYGFNFMTSDRQHFSGQCIEMKEWFLKNSS